MAVLFVSGHKTLSYATRIVCAVDGIRADCSFFLQTLAQTSAAPVIGRIDPPNWWAALPDPMLLVYGQNLGDARFTVLVRIRIEKTQASANGHYAFVWLSEKSAPAQRYAV